MNIFYLNDDPEICAQEHIDKHVVKMITEHVQLLCTAYRKKVGVPTEVVSAKGKKQKRLLLSENVEHRLFKEVKQGAKLVDWILRSKENYLWLLSMTTHLHDEYKYRYDHETNHKSFDVFLRVPKFDDSFFAETERTEAISYMNSEYIISSDPILNYRHYYRTAKRGFANWKKRPVPKWYNEGTKCQ